jgi:hypothetical protein
MARKVFRQDSEQLPAILTAEEEELIALSQKNTKFERNELVVPRLKILQPLNPEVQEDGNQYVAGAKPGMFYNTSSGKLTPGQEGMICCIIGHQRNVVEWVPRTAGGGLVKIWGMDDGWKALCAPDQREAFNPVTKEGHTIDKQRSFLIFDIDTKTGMFDPSFFNMRSTSNRVANQLSTMLTQIRIKVGNQVITPPYYYYVYKCTLERVSNDKGTWWQPRFNKYADKDGLHIKTQDLPNGRGIFEQAKLYQEHFLEGTIQQDSFDQPVERDDLDGDHVAF